MSISTPTEDEHLPICNLGALCDEVHGTYLECNTCVKSTLIQDRKCPLTFSKYHGGIKLEVVFFNQFGLLQGVQRVVGAGMREIGQFVQRFLPLAHVPVQALGEGVEPIGYLVLGTDAGHRILGCGHP